MTVSARVLAGIALVAIVFALFGGVDSALAVCATAVCASPHAAPGPIVGAGLPILAISFGAYWLVGRLRRKPG
jgi:hypothetical protein